MKRLIVPLLCLAGIAPIIHHHLLDGLDGFVLGLLLKEDTAFAPGYSASGFSRVEIGMSEKQVAHLIGEPQKRWGIASDTSGADTGERWSYSPGDTHFRCRVLLFKDHRVVKKHAEFYVD